MSLKKQYHGKKKVNGGPGGLSCPCCNPYHNEKAKSRRMARRMDKQKLLKELRENDQS